MRSEKTTLFLIVLLACCTSPLVTAGLVDRMITITSDDSFDIADGSTIKFKFRPLTEEALALEITRNATSLGVAYLGQVQLKENVTALTALRAIAEQIGKSLNLSFGVIADSNTSEALKANEILLLYHPEVTITLILAKPNEQSLYEIICAYTLRETEITESDNAQTSSKDQAVVTPTDKKPAIAADGGADSD